MVNNIKSCTRKNFKILSLHFWVINLGIHSIECPIRSSSRPKEKKQLEKCTRTQV